MNNQSKNHAFISYARDQARGQHLAETLHKQLLDKSIPVFRDIGGINPGTDWADTLENAVRNSAVVVLIISPEVTDSKWVRREFNLAESLDIPVIPVLAESMSLPWWMTDYQLVDFSQGYDWEKLIPFVEQYCTSESVTETNNNTEASDTPAWASNTGTDDFGRFAELQVKSEMQRFRFIEPTYQAAFWIADTPCTQALWLAVTGKNPSEFKNKLQNPVEQVSWADVQRFLDQLNQSTSALNARLPSEKEWEVACRAGAETPYAFGDTLSPEQANTSSTSTTSVKSFQANNWGLYDMHGNVWEWCTDDADNWGNQKALRGGCWALGTESASAESRGHSVIANRDYTIGFRIVI